MKMFNRANNVDAVSTDGAAVVSASVSASVSSSNSLGDLPSIKQGGKHGIAFAATYLFTLFLYLRPNELFPEIFGTLSIIKFIAITGLVAYTLGKLSDGEALTIMSIEIKMIGLLVVLCLVLMPLSASPSDGWDLFNDTFSKVVLIFILMVNLVDTRQRLISIFNVVIAGGVWVAYYAIQIYRDGQNLLLVRGGQSRIAGVGGGMFGNPNDLADALDMLIPLAFVLGMNRKGIVRWIYFGCAGLFTVGVLITYSRGGFLGLVALSCFLAWKLGRGRRVKMIFACVIVVAFITAVSPGGFGKRIFTIVDSDKDMSGSSYQRTELLKRGIRLVVARPFGIGLNNYHFLSINEEKAHNGYVEISVELGLLGLIAYLIINFAPLRRLMRFEKELGDEVAAEDKEAYFICVGLQAILVAYVVCSFFASIQYFWYLYYPVAHSIAFCRIYERKKAVSSESLALVPVQATGQKATKRPVKEGALWKENQPGALWQAAAGIVKRRHLGRTKVT